MDLFQYNLTYRIWVCKSCQFVVLPKSIPAHLARHHRLYPTARTMAERTAVLEEAVKVQPWGPEIEPFSTRMPSDRPIPGLPVHNAYRYPESDCIYRAWSPQSVQEHCRDSKDTSNINGPSRKTSRPSDYWINPIRTSSANDYSYRGLIVLTLS
jgi:hypothetical protein